MRLVDAPCFDTAVVLIWRKRRYRRRENACTARAFTEQVPYLVRSRGLLTTAPHWVLPVRPPAGSTSAGVAAREARIQSKHPKLGGLILPVSDDPQTTKAWATGAVGEERLGRRLEAAAGPLVKVLHDRGIPGSRDNLDHLVVCPSGVFVVDAKRYQGRPHRVVEGGLFTPRTRSCSSAGGTARSSWTPV